MLWYGSENDNSAGTEGQISISPGTQHVRSRDDFLLKKNRVLTVYWRDSLNGGLRDANEVGSAIEISGTPAVLCPCGRPVKSRRQDGY